MVARRVLALGFLVASCTLPLGEQSTFAKDGRAQALDHVFVTANGAPRYVAKSCHVAADVTGSDHFPLRCDFDP